MPDASRDQSLIAIMLDNDAQETVARAAVRLFNGSAEQLKAGALARVLTDQETLKEFLAIPRGAYAGFTNALEARRAAGNLREREAIAALVAQLDEAI